MNLYFRFFLLILKRLFSLKKITVFDPCDTPFRVNLCDLDINIHMNNGKYLTIMDLGRIDLMLRSGIFWPAVKGGYYPVVTSESIRFKVSLEPFQKFTLTTQVEAWNEKDFYIKQTFTHQGKMMAEGYIKGRFKKRGQKGSVPTREVFALAGMQLGELVQTPLSENQDKIESQLCQTSQ